MMFADFPLTPQEAANLTRRVEAARRRAVVARRKADRRPTAENVTRADEMEAGLASMERDLAASSVPA